MRGIILQAEDGILGLEMALKEKPELILLDILMPNMDGITMLKKLRQSSVWGSTAKVIILSNSTDAETMTLTSGLDAIDFLVKSEWGLEDLLSRIKKHLAATCRSRGVASIEALKGTRAKEWAGKSLN